MIDHIGDNVYAYFGIALVYGEYKQADNAIWAYEKVLEMSPNMVAALQNIGNLYLNEKKMYQEAISVYQRAINVEPENGPLHYNLAVALAKTDRHEEAINHFLTAIDLDSTKAASYNGIAISYYHLEDYGLARIYAQKAKALGYHVQEALLNLK